MNNATSSMSVLTMLLDCTTQGLAYVVPVTENGHLVDFALQLANRAGSAWLERYLEDSSPGLLRAKRTGSADPDWLNELATVWQMGAPAERDQYDARWRQWTRLSFQPMADGLVIRFTDITEQKARSGSSPGRSGPSPLPEQAANVLSAVTEQYTLLQSVIDNSLTGIVLYGIVRDGSGAIVDFVYKLTNEVNARTTGRSVAEMTGKRLLSLFPNVSRAGFYDKLVQVAETQEPHQWTFRIDSDNIECWIEASLVPHGEDVLFTFLDITDLKKKELELQQHAGALALANLDLKRSNEYLQQFAYVASHDLQEPLRKIQSFGDILTVQYGPLLPEGATRHIDRMQNAARRMSNLVNDLLTYSRLATHQQPFQAVNLRRVVDSVLGDRELAILGSKARIEVGELPTVMADPGQMYQLFGNLIGNALKYVTPGKVPVVQVSSRRIEAEALPTEVLTVNAPGSQAYWEITVRDEGIGFEEKYLDRLFGMFQRLHGKTQYEGSGMGLAICKRVVDNHRGGITAYSQPGSGSVFVVYLPVELP